MFNKNYNSNRGKLLLPEYGRNILQMIDALKIIQNRDDRNNKAKEIIDVMGNINPTLRDSSDYRHKLWDHLFIIADFDLDIDSPYPIPNRDSLAVQPNKLKYSQTYISHRQYGKNIRRVLNKLSSMEIEDKEKRDLLVSDIAKFMKFKSYEFNQEFPSDEVVLKDMRSFSDNGIEIDGTALDGSKIGYNNRNQKNQKNGTKNNQKFSKNNKNPKASDMSNKSNRKRFIVPKRGN